MDNNTTYTYIGGEITFGSTINSGFGIDSSLVRYIYIENEDDKYDKYRDSVYKVITELIKDLDLLNNRVTALENTKVYVVNSVILTNLTCEALSSTKALPAAGGTFTIEPNNGYSLPRNVSVEGADCTWDQSTGKLVISNVTSEINVSASGDINIPDYINICDVTGNRLDEDKIIKGNEEKLKIKVIVTGNKSLLGSQCKFKVTSIPSGITVKNGDTPITTSSTELNNNTVLTISGKQVMSVKSELEVTANSNNKAKDLLCVTVEDGSTTALSIKTSSSTTSSNLESKGGDVALTASVSSTKFSVGTVTWTASGGSFKNGVNTGKNVTFVAPENTSTDTAVKYTITATCDGIQSNEYIVNVAKKAVDTKYYWYAGWTEPTVGNIDTIINEVNGKSGQYIGTQLGTYTKTSPLAIVDYYDTNYSHFFDKFYIVIPDGIKVYDSEGEATLEDIFDSTDITIPGHRVIISKEPNNTISCYLLR